MTNEKVIKKRYGTTTKLTLNVQYACCIMTTIFAFFCYFKLNVKGVIFQALLIYSILNFINILLFFRHERLEIIYNISSFLAFVVTYVVCLFSGGINSLFTTFMVMLVFFGYITNIKYGHFWLLVVTLAMISLYIIGNSFNIENTISTDIVDDFSFFIIIFLIALFGGVFGILVSKNNDKIRKAKKEIAKKNEEKAVMLKEIHHRVKNNLHVVNSLLRIQSRSVESDDVKLMFSMAQSRIIAMARLHEKIYKTNNLKYINVKDHIQELIDDLINSYNIDKNITTKLNIESLKISIDTLLPISLIVNELISNSLKHAFENKNNGMIEVSICEKTKNTYELVIGDNGVGMTKNLFDNFVNGTGARLIKTFVRQLKGNISFVEDREGTYFKINFQETVV